MTRWPATARKEKKSRERVRVLQAYRHCPVCGTTEFDLNQPGYYVCDLCKANAAEKGGAKRGNAKDRQSAESKS